MPINHPSFSKTCRICLEEDDSHPQSFISPCKCSGTLKYVHHYCLLNWLNASLLRSHQQNTSTEAHCQICKHKYDTQIKKEIQANSCSQFKKHYNENRLVFILALISIVGSLGCIIYFSQQMALLDITIDSNDPNKYLLIVGLPFLIFMTILLSIKWTLNFFIKITPKYLLIRQKPDDDLALQNTASTFPRN